MMDGFLNYTMLAGVGLVAGAFNTVAGGGSFLTLPFLMVLGLPATEANGTNRLAVILQSLTAFWEFRRSSGRRDGDREGNGNEMARRLAVIATIPTILGSLLGAWISLAVGDQAFKKILSILMVAVTVWTLWDPVGKKKISLRAPESRYGATHALLFLLVGLYGGFVQAGVGFLILAVTTYSGLDLVRGNAVKVFSVLLLTGVSLVFFAWHGTIDWSVGLALGAGSSAGGLLGARLSVRIGATWIQRIVIAAVFLFAIVLWISD
ncbi:MAG TPA: sulfite exporter TauE/SafE family protein [Nitrospiraceae bacterium]|nr:sulfite exporter TauE/SafE family protein [Nitrospiraceae bacterium]